MSLYLWKQPGYLVRATVVGIVVDQDNFDVAAYGFENAMQTILQKILAIVVNDDDASYNCLQLAGPGLLYRFLGSFHKGDVNHYFSGRVQLNLGANLARNAR